MKVKRTSKKAEIFFCLDLKCVRKKSYVVGWWLTEGLCSSHSKIIMIALHHTRPNAVTYQGASSHQVHSSSLSATIGDKNTTNYSKSEGEENEGGGRSRSHMKHASCNWDVCLQCYSAGLPGGVAEELGGHAGANAGRQRIPGDWVPAGEGQWKADREKPRLHHDLLSGFFKAFMNLFLLSFYFMLDINVCFIPLNYFILHYSYTHAF